MDVKASRARLPYSQSRCFTIQEIMGGCCSTEAESTVAEIQPAQKRRRTQRPALGPPSSPQSQTQDTVYGAIELPAQACLSPDRKRLPYEDPHGELIQPQHSALPESLAASESFQGTGVECYYARAKNCKNFILGGGWGQACDSCLVRRSVAASRLFMLLKFHVQDDGCFGPP